MEGETESLILLILLERLSCQWAGGCFRQKFLYVGPTGNVSVFLAIFKKTALARSWRVKGAFTQPAFMGQPAVWLLVTPAFPVHLVDKLVLVFLVLLKGVRTLTLRGCRRLGSMSAVSHQPDFMGSCLSISHMCLSRLPSR